MGSLSLTLIVKMRKVDLLLSEGLKLKDQEGNNVDRQVDLNQFFVNNLQHHQCPVYDIV